MVERVRIEEDEEDAGIEPIKISVKFKPTKWVQWKLGFQTYLCQMRGLQQVPLTYVIRSQTLPPNLLTRIVEEIRLYTIALEGPLYQSDNRNVWNLLKTQLLETDGYTWIKKHERTSDGRAAWLSLVEHYDGPGMTKLWRLYLTNPSVTE